ncbi:hypothetical protein K504DRAFT_383403 [Pleomassaria siparia CBS 279.74]|uniref:Uncharacterized protein n=1 Tax=Pleomassaria siparia CBS 279.74 TaxID=1314801 RepID=A0A6G1K4I5_9PLEO|nr:hypothetical protein K504DRAFT_383403 [Pleomassaria siparia CBS 279.74]
MKLAEILSDLVSLRICDPTAALSLVTVRTKPRTAAAAAAAAHDQDADLQRAKDLVDLHYSVKEAHRRGELGRGLVEARENVRRAVGG